MLQRAASNAYSWWWASHIRTKQSKWLEQNLHDMEEKVDNMMRIIDGDGDSFAKRAEMYYRKRPELVEHVEESFRAYRSLAEKYDHLSKDFQGANRTIASIFPERVHYTIDDDDCEVDYFPRESSSAKSTHMSSSEFDGSPKLGIIPEVPTPPEKAFFKSPSMIRKALLKRNASNASNRAASTPKSSGLNKTEAIDEIDKLQKEILARQTEMEFVKSLYERECEKYWEIETSITDMQKRVGNLQDEFGIGAVIEDNEARTLIAATALKTCRETLSKLQEEQKKTVEDTRLENNRIKKVNKEFESLKCKILSNSTNNHAELYEDLSTETQLTDSDQQVACTAEDKHDIELLDQKIREYLEMNSNSSFTISELAEKIDMLVNKIVTLETAVSSQTSLVRRLKSETDVLQTNVKQLEEEKEILEESSETMKKKIKELEAELAQVKNINQNVQIQNNNLQTEFAETSCNLDHLFGKLQTMTMYEEAENSEFFQDVMMVDPDVKTATLSSDLGLEGKKDEPLQLGNIVLDEEHESIIGNKNLSFIAEEAMESMREENEARSQPQIEKDLGANEGQEEEKNPTLRQLFLKGLEDREKILLEEYTSVLRDYKDVRNKLSEVEEKNRDSILELAMQVKELKHAISSKDDIIKSLGNNAETDEDTNARGVGQEQPQESIHGTPSSMNSQSSTPLLDQDSIPDFFGEQSIDTTERNYKPLRNVKSLPNKDLSKKATGVDKSYVMSPTEERFRSDIDGQLETNLEFWLRFSTSVHQIQKFQTSIQDLQSEMQKLTESNQQEGSAKHHQSIESNGRSIYTHLIEIQTELSLWLEHSAVLKDELCSRFESLDNIQNEISRITHEGSNEERAELSDYQAARFQGEVLNMKQENKKISDELEGGQGRTRALQVQVEKALERLDQEFGISASKSIGSRSKSLSRTRIPLRAFLFGVKIKRQRPSSLFSCASPQLDRQFSFLSEDSLPQ